jgi:hypothetical protein
MMRTAEARLVVLGGGTSGDGYALRLGDQVVGRDGTADLVLSAPDVSRRHAVIRWDGVTASVTDVGSKLGTEVNGYRIVGSQAIRSGDVVRVGSVRLRFEMTDQGDVTAALPSPPVGNQMAIGGNNYGELHQAGRDIRISKNKHLIVEDPMDELFRGQGLGRALMAIGLLIALAGFAGWMYVIFSAGRDGGVSDPFAGPEPMVAFGAFAVGGVIASIGKGMSKAARERARGR